MCCVEPEDALDNIDAVIVSVSAGLDFIEPEDALDDIDAVTVSVSAGLGPQRLHGG